MDVSLYLRRCYSCVRLFVISQLWRHLSDMWFFWLLIKKLEASFRPFYSFVILSFGLSIYVFFFYYPKKTEIDLVDFSLNNAEIIGASIALIFAFSIFALQRMADFLPARHIQFLTKNSKEGVFFGLLVFLIFISLFTPIFFPDSPKLALWILLTALLGCFFIVYLLYIELSQRINPSRVMQKIESDIIKFLEKTRKKHECLHQKNDAINLFGSAQDKVKDLHEIGLKLLDKNEVQSFKNFLWYIKEISLKHLRLGDGCFIDDNNNCNFNMDKLFFLELLECLLSTGYRLVQEKREDLIKFLLALYTPIFIKTLTIKSADGAECITLPNWVLIDYQKFIRRVFSLKNDEIVYMIVTDLLEMYEKILQKTDKPDTDLLKILLESLEEVKKHDTYKNADISSVVSELKEKLKEN